MVRWSVLLSCSGGVRSCEVKECVGGMVQCSACNEVKRTAALSSWCLHQGELWRSSSSKLCKCVGNALQKREPTLG